MYIEVGRGNVSKWDRQAGGAHRRRLVAVGSRRCRSIRLDGNEPRDEEGRVVVE